jgi:hypothetical protein
MAIVDSSPTVGTILPAPPPRFRATDTNGAPLVGGQLFTYQAGTVTPLATFDGSGAANTNPVLLDANGEASVRLGPGPYKFVLEDADGNQLWAEDNIPGSGWAIIANPTAPQTISGQKLISEAGFEGAIGSDNPLEGGFSEVVVTASTSKQRITNTPNLGQVFSANLEPDGVTRDVPGRFGIGLAFDTINGGAKLRIVSPGGSVKDYAPRLTAGADFTAHENTGGTTLNTLLTRTIVGNTLGPSGGLRIRCYIHSTVQGAVASTLAVHFNGLQAATMSIAAGGFYVWEVLIGMRGLSTQVVYGVPQFYGPGTPALLPVSAGVAATTDFSQDVAIDIRAQNGAPTDDLIVDMFEMSALTTFAI